MGACNSSQSAAVSQPGAFSKKRVPTKLIQLPPPSAAYDKDLVDAWGGPMPALFPTAMTEWPKKFGTATNTDRTALITGSTGGIGFYVAKMLAQCGFEVIMPKRVGYEEEAMSARETIMEEVPGSKVTVLETGLDLASFESVRAFAKDVRAHYETIDVLCLHAGRGGAKGDARETTVDGHEAIVQVNMLSHFLLSSELIPLLRMSSQARIVVQTSGARFDPFNLAMTKVKDLDGTKEATFNAFDQYRVSKAGGCLFVRAINQKLEEVGATNVVACVSDPGLSATGVNAQHNLGHSMFMLPNGCLNTRRMHNFGQHAADGALPMAMACLDPDVKANDWYTPKKGLSGLPVRADPSKHMQAKVDPLNAKSAWPKDAPEVFWEQSVALSGAKWVF